MTISELKAAAQQHFRRPVKLTAKGRQLDLTATLYEAGLRDGDVVAAVVQLGKLATTLNTFAWHNEPEVLTWGARDPFGGTIGGDFALQERAQYIQATNGAFAAILESGAVVTLGAADLGGGSDQVQEQLRNVKCIQATRSAFAAILESGVVVTWGYPYSGGDSSQVQEQLRNVQHIQATAAFAAILGSGVVVTGGDPECSGESR